MENLERMMPQEKGISHEKFMSRFSAREREEINSHAERLIAEEMLLRDLRKAMGKTQTHVARMLGKPQTSVSRLEQQSDMLLSTLDRYVRAMGGRVRIVAELPGRPPVYLSGFTVLADKPAVRRAAGPARRRAAAKQASG
jgi:hypothetical protein